MEYRTLGKTGLQVSVLGFGCGFVGGLMVRGTEAEQRNALMQAQNLGINYFDTAPFYGQGESEANLGRALHATGYDAIVGTKVRIAPDQLEDIDSYSSSIVNSVEASLRRLRRDSIDLLQLHNGISPVRAGSGLHPDVVANEIVPVFQRLVREGKVRFTGMTALGDSAAIISLIKAGLFDTAQVAYSLLNPSAAILVPESAGMENYARMLDPMRESGTGVIGIRLLAGGALSGDAVRHPTALATVAPVGKGIGSGNDYLHDVEMAHCFDTLVKDGTVDSLVSAALRYGRANPDIATMAIGFSDSRQLQYAAQCVLEGLLDAKVLMRIAKIQQRWFSPAATA